MSMSDDEDDTDDESDAPPPRNRRGLTLSPILEPEDVVFPYIDYPRSAPPDGRFPRSIKSSHRRDRSSQSATTDWLPLKSFIDLQADDELSRWTCRSFIDLANLS